VKDQPTITSSVPFQMSIFSTIVSSNGIGTINFVVNIYPTGNIFIGNSIEVKCQDNKFDTLLKSIDVDDLFSDINLVIFDLNSRTITKLLIIEFVGFIIIDLGWSNLVYYSFCI